jgi:hypothetical protein
MEILGINSMDDKELKKYKKSQRIHNVNDLTESKTIKYRKNKKRSIDVKYEKRLITPEDRKLVFEKHGIKNNDGSYTMGGSAQLIEEYMNKLYGILKSIGVPSDDRVKYKLDGSIVPLDTEDAYRVWAYLGTDKFVKIPNVHRIGWLLARFYNIKLNLASGDLITAVNSLLFAIEEYKNIILISIEGDIVPHTTQAATQEKMLAKSERIKLAFSLADDARKLNPNLKTKSAIARVISTKTPWAFETIRQDYLKEYEIEL